LGRIAPVTIAVSGGVDSMTLASFAQRKLGREKVQMAHAASPAVPAAAGRRIRDIANAENWQLDIVDAAELADPSYRANPVNRCFFCKSNLYSTLSRLAPGAIASGANCDDLADYRPGLEAARNFSVCHPYIEADLNKVDVRRLARMLGHDNLAELPSSPCLSSRIESGIAIDEADLHLIDRIESWLRETLGPATVRCRIRRTGIVIELDAEALVEVESRSADKFLDSLAAGIPDVDRETLQVACYRQGSAFVGARPATRSSFVTSS